MPLWFDAVVEFKPSGPGRSEQSSHASIVEANGNSVIFVSSARQIRLSTDPFLIRVNAQVDV
jgi:hypothetical protein